MMNIEFGQIYVELNTDFDLPSFLLKKLREELDSLGKDISHFNAIFKHSDFKLVFIISATRKNDELNVKGPTLVRKNPAAEFVIFIPYKEIVEFVDKVSYVLPYVAEGVAFVFNKYKEDSSGVEDAVHKVIAAVNNDPEAFQRKSKIT